MIIHSVILMIILSNKFNFYITKYMKYVNLKKKLTR